MKPKIKKPSVDEIKEAENWPIWEKEISEFPWEYTENETFLVVEGEVSVENEEGEKFNLGKGDYVTFPKGMKCKWQIKKDVRKHYKFG